jgi:hypothetical protein
MTMTRHRSTVPPSKKKAGQSLGKGTCGGHDHGGDLWDGVVFVVELALEYIQDNLTRHREVIDRRAEDK